jgi:hypothetical protein
MNATGIIYPQYWPNPLVEERFWGHLNFIEGSISF